MKLVLLALAIIGYCFDINSGCCCKKKNDGNGGGGLGNLKSKKSVHTGGGSKPDDKNKDMNPGEGGGKPTPAETNKFDAEIIVRPDGVTIKPVGNPEIKLSTIDIEKEAPSLVNDAYLTDTVAYKFNSDELFKNAKVTVDNKIEGKPYLIAIVSLEGDESSKYIVIVSNEDGDMASLFYNLNITEVSLLSSDGITSIQDIFRECRHLTVCNINIDTSMVINMRSMFAECSSLTTLSDISKWDTSNVTDMCFMFYGCSSLTSLPHISNWDTKSVVDMHGMFYGCGSLSSLPDISKWDTSNVTDMSEMFKGCEKLKSLPDISKWNINNVTDMGGMFEECIDSIISEEIKTKFNL